MEQYGALGLMISFSWGALRVENVFIYFKVCLFRCALTIVKFTSSKEYSLMSCDKCIQSCYRITDMKWCFPHPGKFPQSPGVGGQSPPSTPAPLKPLISVSTGKLASMFKVTNNST